MLLKGLNFRTNLASAFKEVKIRALQGSLHSEEVFKQILGGVTPVVHGLGAMRNCLGDTHGQGKAPVRPAQRHAQLAVNLAGSTALFIVETWEAGTGSAGRGPHPNAG